MRTTGWRSVLDAFRVELGHRGRPSRPGTRTGRRRGGVAPRCGQCELFVKAMCIEPYNPCGVCCGCCPGYDTHQPPRKDQP